MLKPWLLETAEKYDGKVKFVAVDTMKSAEVATKYEVESLPTFVLVKDGEEVSRIVGAATVKDDLPGLIDKSL